jgi:hypothetical protein
LNDVALLDNASALASSCRDGPAPPLSGIRSDERGLDWVQIDCACAEGPFDPNNGYQPMAVLAKEDVLVVTRLDRLARSTRDLLNLLGTIAEKGAGFKSLRDTWADTTTAHGRLMLTVLGGSPSSSAS